MIFACLLALALQQPAAASGTLALCGESFELAEPLARELAGDKPHLVLDLDAPGVDPLARGGTAALRPDLSGEWSMQREAALLPELARSGAVVLTARTWLSCWLHFKPEFKDSRLEQELRAALRAGRTVVATGAAASYCASWALVTREETQRTRRNPRREDPNLVTNGLAFAEGWMVDTARQPEASATRLLRAAQDFGNARALYLEGPVAWIVRDADARVEIAGSGCAVVFDLAHARRSRTDLREGRLLLLTDGDRLRLQKELELVPAQASPKEDATRADGLLQPLALPFRPVRIPRPGLEFTFDWIATR